MTSPHQLLLQECIDRFARGLVEDLHAEGKVLRQSVEDRLVTESSTDRRKLLTIMIERLDDSWTPFCERFHNRLLYEGQRTAGLIGAEAVDETAEIASLKLVDDEQMESDLALSGFGSRVMASVGELLSEVSARVDVLLQRHGLGQEDDAGNPLDTSVLVGALKRSLDRLIPEADIRRSFLVILHPSLSSALKKQFAQIKEWLVEEGVEPVQRVRQSASRSGNPAADGGAGSDEMLSVLQQLVQNAGANGGGGGGAGMVAVPAAMLESLNRLQSLDLSALQSGAALESGSNNVLRDLRQHESVRSLPPIEAVTIDIVATMFDFIFDDALVPDSVKALVGRLQIPLLKVAMLDKSFFSNKEHPARALLNEISRASISAGKDLAQGDPVFEKIRSVVNRILAESEKEQGVFAELLPEIKALVVDQEKRGDQLAEKSKVVAERQEQGEIAEAAASEAFVRILEGGINEDVPSHIADFLTRKYPLVMKRALLNGGTAGVAWTLATQTLSDLLWSLTPKPTPEDRQRMVALLPDLLRRLNAFFEKVGVTPEEKNPFIDALAQVHSKVIKGVRKAHDKKSRDGDSGEKSVNDKPLVLAASGIVASQNMAPTVVVTRVVQEDGVEVESMTVSGRLAGSRPIRSLDVSALKRGDWVEFLDDAGGESLRARLSWTSPNRGVMLFTNPQTQRAVSVSPEAMAIKIKRGQAKVLGDNPLMERALTKTMDSMKPA